MKYMYTICKWDNLDNSLTNIWAEYTYIIITATGLSLIMSCIIYTTTQRISFEKKLKV